MEKETLTVIHQGDSYLFKTGGYNTHLAIDGKHFAKTSDLQIGYCPKKVEIGTDKTEVDFYTRDVNGKTEKITSEQYRDMSALMQEECKDDDNGYISLEHEYKYRKAMNGWIATYKSWVDWKEYPFQVLELVQTNNPLITGYLSEKALDNPLVDYKRNKVYIVSEAFKRLGIDIMKAQTSSSYNGVPKVLSRRTETWRGNQPLYEVHYDSIEIVDSDDFKRPIERITLDKALELFEEDVESVIAKYHKAYAHVNAQITEDNGRKLGDALYSIERQARSLNVYQKDRTNRDALLITIKNAKTLLGIE